MNRSQPPRDRQPRWLLELEAQGLPLDHPADEVVPPIHRLRKLLKVALRAYGLRCIRCEEVGSKEQEQQEEEEQQP
jgi:hypothetical protein